MLRFQSVVFRLLILIWAVAGSVGAQPALAQNSTAQGSEKAASQAQPAEEILPGTGAEQGIIKLDVVVTDRGGNPVSTLQQNAFTVFDNGQPSTILAFHRFDGQSSKANPPVEVILFLDSIGIPKDMAEFEKQEVQRFLRQNEGHLGHPTSVYGLSSGGLWMVNQASGDGNVLAAQLEKSSGTRRVVINSELSRNGMSGRGGAFGSPLASEDFVRQYPSGAAFQAISAVAIAARRRPGRKMLLWIGSGCCKGSGAYLSGPNQPDEKQNVFDMANWASTLFREAHLTIYSFSESDRNALDSAAYQPALEGPTSPNVASWMSIYKKTIAIQTGGRVLTPDPAAEGKTYELMNQIDDVIRGADTFYMIAIDPAHADHRDDYHTLKVSVDRDDLKVRTKAGYYDQPYYRDEPNPALKRVTMEQVEAILKADRADHDAELAKQLSYLELTERMTSAKLRNWIMLFRGKKTRAALVALSDASAFLDPPKDEILPDAPPSASETQKMLTRVGDYLGKTIPKLPNFFAARTTVRYEDVPAFHQGNSKTDYQPLHVEDTAKATVLYRNGNEVVESRQKYHVSSDHQLEAHGTFGPMLKLVSLALQAKGSMRWIRWESGGDGRKAVFQWAVPLRSSIYSVGGCCLPDGNGTAPFTKRSGYNGEIEIDPDSGAILRFELRSDSSSNDPPITTPLARSGVMIEYGTVEVGGLPYVCPIRSVTLSKVRSVVDLTEWDLGFKSYGPYWTLLNDVTFADYHRFRSDAQMLTDSPADQ